ncbi:MULTISPECIES: hypothetical protein [Streptomyces]|uniref:Uncharacterized protein n=1 Tax=Streptomyces eurythermus TaxID=42237 RepID=A0ABW6Z387_9ACTN|nr:MULTISPECIES: hypothetical protein [Streptomyces]
MVVAMVDAVRLAKANRRRYEHLVECQEALGQRAAAENAAEQRARQALYDEALVPFRDVLQRLERVDPVELAEVELPAGGGEVGVEFRRLREGAVTAAVGALAGGALAGSGAGAGTFLAVGAFATASTGTAISGLSGAAAISATLAWLGGGSLAAGGGGMAAGTTVLSAIVAAPVVLSLAAVVEWQSRRARRGQREMAQDLERAEAEMREAEEAASALYERSKETRRVLRDLRFVLVKRLPYFHRAGRGVRRPRPVRLPSARRGGGDGGSRRPRRHGHELPDHRRGRTDDRGIGPGPRRRPDPAAGHGHRAVSSVPAAFGAR